MFSPTFSKSTSFHAESGHSQTVEGKLYFANRHAEKKISIVLSLRKFTKYENLIGSCLIYLIPVHENFTTQLTYLVNGNSGHETFILSIIPSYTPHLQKYRKLKMSNTFV